METLTKICLEKGLANKWIRDTQLKHSLEGSNARRYALVTRAIKAGELIHPQRGLYFTSPNSQWPHPFSLAQSVDSLSYISFESALSFHQWIPESATYVSSVTPNRKSRTLECKNLGMVRLIPLAHHKNFFLEKVERKTLDGQVILIASPMRALLDLVSYRKITWTNLGWLHDGLRIDEESLRTATADDLIRLRRVYKHRKVHDFINSLAIELHLSLQSRN